MHVFRPEWSTAFCHDAEQAATTRRALLSEAAESGTLLLPAHLRGSMAMTIAQDSRSPSGYRPEYL